MKVPLNPENYPPQAEPIYLDRLDIQTENFILEKVSNDIELGLLSTYYAYRPLFLTKPDLTDPIHQKVWKHFKSWIGKNARHRMIKRLIIFPVLNDRKIFGSERMKHKFAEKLIRKLEFAIRSQAEILEVQGQIQKIRAKDREKQLAKIYSSGGKGSTSGL